MEELLHSLEAKIKSLIDHHDKLKHANRELNHGKSRLSLEKEELLTKQLKAIEQIEGLVLRLRSIEELS